MTATKVKREFKTNQETWLDWMPVSELTGARKESDELFTRDEILQELEKRGIVINPETFRSWERYGLLPRAVRQWHQGAVRAVYPSWIVGAATLIRSLLDKGWSRGQIKGAMDRLRDGALHPNLGKYLFDVTLHDVYRAIDQWGYAFSDQWGKTTVTLTVTNEQGETVVAESRSYEPTGNRSQ